LRAGEGFDTVAASFKVPCPDMGEGASVQARIGVGLEQVRTLRKLPGGGTLRSGVGGTAVVEVSARYGRSDNVVPLSWSDSVASVRAAYEDAGSYVSPLGSFDDVRFVRVDAVRDFDGGQGWPFLAAALEPQLGFPRARSRMFRDRARSGSLTLAIGNGGWRAAVYDKHAEWLGKAPEGRLRYEYRQGSHWCRSLEVSARSPGLSVARARSLFTDCRFSCRVTGVDKVLEEVLASSGLRSTEAYRLLGFVIAESRGVTLPQSRTTLVKYRKLAADVGITPARLGSDVEIAASLDWEAGRMVMEVAA